jgi:hypothetical protein
MRAVLPVPAALPGLQKYLTDWPSDAVVVVGTVPSLSSKGGRTGEHSTHSPTAAMSWSVPPGSTARGNGEHSGRRVPLPVSQTGWTPEGPYPMCAALPFTTRLQDALRSEPGKFQRNEILKNLQLFIEGT